MKRILGIAGAVIFLAGGLLLAVLPYALGYLVADAIKGFFEAIWNNPANAALTVLLTGALGLYIAFVLTMRNAVACCASQSRTLNPNWTWLLMVPVLNQIAGLALVVPISSSLENEFHRLNISDKPKPGTGVGLSAFLLGAIDILFLKAGTGPSWIAATVSLICLILYWKALRRCTKLVSEAKLSPMKELVAAAMPTT